MKAADVYKKNCFKRIMVLVICVVLSQALSVPAGAEMSQNLNLTMQQNFGSMVSINQTLFNVRLPVNISNMPGAWKNATLKGFAAVSFLDGSGELIGYGFGPDGESLSSLNAVLNNGNYNGTVVFPIRKVAGGISGKTCSTAIVAAQLGNQIMIIGTSRGGTAPNSNGCMNISNLEPGTILSY